MLSNLLNLNNSFKNRNHASLRISTSTKKVLSNISILDLHAELNGIRFNQSDTKISLQLNLIVFYSSYN